MIKTIGQNRLLSGAVGIAAVALSAASFTAGAAGRHDPGVNHRQANQQSRIGQGVRQGDLTRGETRHLERQQGHIAREEARYKADGHLSRWERADLHRDQNQASRDIRRERHDGDLRFSGNHGDVRHPGVNQRQFNQRERIQGGVRSGELTRAERASLAAEQRGIRQEERQYRSDGRFTRDERRDVQQDLNVASRSIYNETHDADRRY